MVELRQRWGDLSQCRRRVIPTSARRPFERRHAALFLDATVKSMSWSQLIIAHTEVLLYSQSGAGKSSLVNARLIPLLEAEGFDVLPSARVQGVVEGVAPGGDRQYLRLSHDDELGGSRCRCETQFARTSLGRLLTSAQNPVDDAGNPVLRIAIFDQFEELFTAYPDRWQRTSRLFIQVREAIEEADSGLRTVSCYARRSPRRN